jgi:hypothetical protein
VPALVLLFPVAAYLAGQLTFLIVTALGVSGHDAIGFGDVVGQYLRPSCLYECVIA